ncbi:MAG: hypothetical protein COS94_04430 [Candidatus Hydrogenedentes bacterium CG07_land_8_20_14_0_80_42_17]|nr:MAG: hypothetical protein COS94_04430 [Candidatus Hydrogenedentes bacterium CG07_land_8_20_14_0_80_42_17]
MKRTVIIMFLLLAIFVARSEAISNSAGTSGADFLRIEAGARHVAMGGTYSAYGSSVFTLYGQPAAIAEKDGYEIGFQYSEWVQGISQQFGGFKAPFLGGKAAVTFNFLGSNNIEKTTDDAFGRFGVSSGTFGVSDFSGAIHYARRINSKTAWGIAGRYIRSEIDNISASGFSGDIGIRHNLNEHFSIGASATNIGPGLKFINDRSDLPMTLRIGASYHTGNFLIAGDIANNGVDNVDAMIGAEWKPTEIIAIRAGYKTQMQSDLNEGLTAGIGLALKSIEFDYAYVPFGPLGDTHRISGSISF